MRIHKKHGLNPTIPACWFCGEDKGEVALLGAAIKGQAPMRGMVINADPCDECEALMDEGVFFVSVDPGTGGWTGKGKNRHFIPPDRAGPLAVISSEGVKRMPIPADLKSNILNRRVCLVPADEWSAIGFPTEDFDNRETKKKGNE